MLFPTVLSHSSQLFNIINTSVEASDRVASKYLRPKKYIGSKERRFISESVFTTLRMRLTLEHCVDLAIKEMFGNNKNIALLHNREDRNYSAGDFLMICACVMISDIYPSDKKAFDPVPLIVKITSLKEFKVPDLLAEAMVEETGIEHQIAMEWINRVKKAFKHLHHKTKLAIENPVPQKDTLKLISIRTSMPYWIQEYFSNYYNDKFSSKDLYDIFESFLHSAALSIRVNQVHIKRDMLLQAFLNQSYKCSEGNLSPASIIFHKRTLLMSTKEYKKGLFEVQDEGSQMISFAVAPESDWKILDACAGAGGKSLHLADLQNDKGQIIAADVIKGKLFALSKRMRRPGFQSIVPHAWNSKNKPPNEMKKGSFDAVLVDAPCSGTGTIRRMPYHKWRLDENLLERLTKKQLSILKQYSSYVKPGGILVYATCSIMPQENDVIADKFLKSEPDFEPYPVKPALETYGIHIKGLEDDSNKFHLYPVYHGCDGFFAAKFKRRTV